ncbi:MAG: NUDIX hydrolase [Alphaproteobacteria bacterium]|nr:NUDIX hydrolase [Alphaproteobacteria bacterium]
MPTSKQTFGSADPNDLEKTSLDKCFSSSNGDNEARYVKVIVFDEQCRVLALNSNNKFVLPGGKIEWDDDDAETAARREVFEAANMAIGLVIPVTIIDAKNRNKQIIRTVVFAARMSGEAQNNPNHKHTYRFLRKEDLFETTGFRNELMRTLVGTALKALVSEEIKEDYEQTTLRGSEKYNVRSLL